MGQVLVLMGLPGSGKSTVARELVKRHPQFTWLDTDQIRRFVFVEYFDEDGNPDPLIYEDRMKTVNYQVLLLLTRYLLDCGRDVVIEGVFNSNTLREKIFHVVRELRSNIKFVELEIDDEVAKERLTERIRLSPSRRISDADFSVYLKLKKSREMPSSLIRDYFYCVDATKDLDDIVHEIEQLLDL